MIATPCCPICRAALGTHHAKTCVLWGSVLPSECPGVIDAALVEVLSARLAAAEKERDEAQRTLVEIQTVCVGYGREPKRGRIEDVIDLKAERDAALAQVASLTEKVANVTSWGMQTNQLAVRLEEQLATTERRHVETLTAESAARDGLRAQVEMLREALDELVDIIHEHLETNTRLDSFTTQVAVAALAASESDWLAGLKERVAVAVKRAVRDVADSEREAIDEVDVKAIAAGVK